MLTEGRRQQRNLNVSRTDFFIASSYTLSPALSAWRRQVLGDTQGLCPSPEVPIFLLC